MSRISRRKRQGEGFDSVEKIKLLENQILLLKEALDKEKKSKDTIEDLYSELVDGLDEQVQLKESLKEISQILDVNHSMLENKRELLSVYERQSNAIKVGQTRQELTAIQEEISECEELKVQMVKRVKELDNERKQWIKRKEAMEMPLLSRSRSRSMKKIRSLSKKKSSKSKDVPFKGRIHRRFSTVRERSQKMLEKRSTSFLELHSSSNVVMRTEPSLVNIQTEKKVLCA